MAGPERDAGESPPKSRELREPVRYRAPGPAAPDRLVEAIGHEPGQALRRTIKQEREKRVQGKADRHKATSDDRSSLVAKRALGDMVSTVKF